MPLAHIEIIEDDVQGGPDRGESVLENRRNVP